MISDQFNIPSGPVLGVHLTFVGNDDARRYLSRMDVFQTLDIPFTENFERHNAAVRFVPIKRIEGDSCKPAVDVVLPRQERSLQMRNHGKHGRTRKREVDSDSLFREFRWISVVDL